ncbi:MAG: type II toxin-antitoxin system HicB family antitoxin [Pyrinomonadaceae bacterium]
MKNTYNLPVVLDPQPEGGWTITCPILPELHTEADTWDEIKPNVTDAFQAVIEIYEHLKEPLPQALGPITDKAPVLIDTIVHLEAA